MRSTLLGGLTPMVSAVKTIMLKMAAIRMPTPNAHNSSVAIIRRSCGAWISAIESSHRSARKENQEVNQKVTDDERRGGRASESARTQWYDAHHLAKSGLVHVVGRFEPWSR